MRLKLLLQSLLPLMQTQGGVIKGDDSDETEAQSDGATGQQVAP
jgi:hypothetical protein